MVQHHIFGAAPCFLIKYFLIRRSQKASPFSPSPVTGALTGVRPGWALSLIHILTEFSLFGEKLYLSPILDLCSEDLISCTISELSLIHI